MAESVRVAAKTLPGDRCPYCHDAIGDEPSRTCPECGACLHWECWQETRSCPTLGCEVRSDSLSAPQHPGLKLSVREKVEDVAATVASIFAGTSSGVVEDEPYSAYLRRRGQEELGRRQRTSQILANLGCGLMVAGAALAFILPESPGRRGLTLVVLLAVCIYLVNKTTARVTP